MTGMLLVIVTALVIARFIAPVEAIRWGRSHDIDPEMIRWPSLEEAFSTATGTNESAKRRSSDRAGLQAVPPADESAKWPNEKSVLGDDQLANQPNPAQLPAEEQHYLIYLSGIGISTPEQLPVVEIPMVQHLAARLGKTKLIWEINPYSVDNSALSQGRLLSPFWAAATRWKFHKTRLRFLAALINFRNAIQLFVSADPRYGKVYNLAVARQIAAALIREGYLPSHRRPVTLLGWSGGAQIAAGVTTYLVKLGIDVRVLSMAGIISADPGLDHAKKIWHLRGESDAVEGVGRLLSPRRWKWARNSPWNRALREKRLEIMDLGPLKHTGEHGYYSGEITLPDGRTPRDVTADTIVELLVAEGLATDLGGEWID